MEHIGLLEDLTDTAVQVGGKRFYLPQDIRARIIKEFKPHVEAKPKVSATYSRKGDLQDLKPLEQLQHPVGESPSGVSGEGTEVDIYPATGAGEDKPVQTTTETPAKQPESGVPVRKDAGNGKKIHIENSGGSSAPQVPQEDRSSPTPQKKPAEKTEKKMKEASAFTEFTKNKTIAIEFCISKASDIVAKHWEKIPPDDEHQTLEDKVSDIEKVSDKLLEYLIRKIGES